MDFESLFSIETHPLELMLRAILLYFGILFLMRILPRRTAGELGVTDLIFVLIIAEAAAHAMGEYKSITEGFIVIVTLMLLNYLVNLLSFHFRFVEKMFSAPHLQIVRDGKMLRRNMRIEYITEEELMEQLRKQGLKELSQVKHAYVEGDGVITIIETEPRN